MSLSTGVPTQQMISAFLIKFLTHNYTNNEKELKICSNSFNIPQMNWCPESLLDIANLENYYKQITLEKTIQILLLNPTKSLVNWGFPNAIYLNGIDIDGTIRTGTQVLWGKNRNENDITHQLSSYAYVDTLLLYNVLLGCNNNNDNKVMSDSCIELQNMLVDRRAKHPLTRWTDERFGRQEVWPENLI